MALALTWDATTGGERGLRELAKALVEARDTDESVAPEGSGSDLVASVRRAAIEQYERRHGGAIPDAWESTFDTKHLHDVSPQTTEYTLLPADLPSRRDLRIHEAFEALVRAKSRERDRLFAEVLNVADAGELSRVVFRNYRASGNADRLFVLSGLLEAFGEAALPALDSIARLRAPECGHFASTAAYLDAPEEKRLAILRQMARNPDADTRLRVVEAVSTFSGEAVTAILDELASHDEDGDVREAALEALQEAESR